MISVCMSNRENSADVSADPYWFAGGALIRAEKCKNSLTNGAEK